MPTRKGKKSSMGMGRDLSKPLAETVRPEMSDKEYFDLQSKLRQKARAKMSKQAQLKALSSIEKMKD